MRSRTCCVNKGKMNNRAERQKVGLPFGEIKPFSITDSTWVSVRECAGITNKPSERKKKEIICRFLLWRDSNGFIFFFSSLFIFNPGQCSARVLRNRCHSSIYNKYGFRRPSAFVSVQRVQSPGNPCLQKGNKRANKKKKMRVSSNSSDFIPKCLG